MSADASPSGRSLIGSCSSTTPIQKIITTEKGVAIDFDSVSRDAKAQSKELYTWGQTEREDIKDGAPAAAAAAR